MVMIQKRKLRLLIFSQLSSVCILCAVGCYFIYFSNLTIQNNQKFCAEVLIFLTILALTVNITIIAYVFKYNTRIYTELDKLATFCRTHDIREGASQLRHLDKLGNKLNLIFGLINETGEKRKQKLASMYQIIDYLAITSDKLLLVTNVVGDIQFCSQKFSDSVGLDQDRLRILRISDLIGTSMNQLLYDIERKKTTLIMKNQMFHYEESNRKIKELQILPVCANGSDVSNLIFLFSFGFI